MSLTVKGKIALITGGTRGLGLNCAEALVENDASTIIITSRKQKACQEAKQHLEDLAKGLGKSCKIISIPCDIANDAALENFFKQVSAQVSKLDILFANAGATWGAHLEEHPVAAVRKVLDLNITGVFHTIKLFTPLLSASGSAEDPSRIIINASVAGINPNDFAGTYGYLASKAGIIHLGKNLAIQLGPKNITVNSLAPGFFPTKMSNGLLGTVGDEMTRNNPRRRLGVKKDIQNAFLFLAAKESNYINGIVLPVDGGSVISSKM